MTQFIIEQNGNIDLFPLCVVFQNAEAFEC